METKPTARIEAHFSPLRAPRIGNAKRDKLLDIAFRGYASQVRKDQRPENFAILRHMALNLFKQEKTAKGRIQAKGLQAVWNEAYLLKVLEG